MSVYISSIILSLFKRGGKIISFSSIVILFIFVVSCKKNEKTSSNKDIYIDFLQKFDTKFPGRGMIDYPGNADTDNAKSYAMVLNAELNRMIFENTELSEHGKSAGLWLLNNTLNDEYGNVGWGINSKWDAFGDGTENSENTIYTISTSIAIEALLNWIELDNISNKAAIWDLIDKVINPYIYGKAISVNGLIPYSCNPNDFKYNCYNPAIHMAGQLQRISNIHPNIKQRKIIASIASNNFKILLDDKRLSNKGNWYWNYSDFENIPNDLPHALYIINGINAYINEGGEFASSFNIEKVNNHLNDFIDDSLSWHSWPLFRNDLTVNPEPRLYDLGYALAFCSEFYPQYADSLYVLSKKYKSENGLYRKYINDTVYINEYQSYMLYGLSKYFFKSDFTVKYFFENYLYKSDSLELPFSDLSTKYSNIKFLIDTLKLNAYILINEYQINLKDNIPLGAEELGTDFFIFCRKLFNNEFSLYQIDKHNTTKTISIDFDLKNHVYRKSFIFNNELYVILYNPIVNSNFLYKLLKNETSVVLKKIIEIPLGDYLGYNHQPNFITKSFFDKCYIISSNNLFLLNKNDSLQLVKFNLNTELIDIVSSTSKSYLLAKHIDLPIYSTNNIFKNQYKLININDTSKVINLDSSAIFYNPKIIFGIPTIYTINNKTSAYHYLVWNLKRMNNNGVMSIGVNNFEGELVWTQSYYLNAFNDFIFLSDKLNLSDSRIDGLKKEFHKRLKFEAFLIYKLLKSPYNLFCKIFTTDRKPVLHAVQTGKTTLLLQRLYNERNIGDSLILGKITENTFNLNNHIEKFGKTGENYREKENYHSIVWPKGVNFKYDGNVIPYNHQNCWAASVLYNYQKVDSNKIVIAKDIVYTLIELELDSRYKSNNSDYYWNYWWGIAKKGWNKKDNVSLNTPKWRGDGESVALARYRTFDAISVMGLKYTGNEVPEKLIQYLKNATYEGGLELFLLPYFYKTNTSFQTDKINYKVILSNHKFDSQPSLRNTLIAWQINYSNLN